MPKKKITKASKRRLFIFGTLSIGIMIYFVISLCTYAMNIYHLQAVEKGLANNLVDLKKDEKRLKTEIEKLKDPEYLARYARENYLYSKNGEIVIKVQDEKKVEESNPDEPYNYSYIIFCGSIILLIIIGYVMKKSRKK